MAGPFNRKNPNIFGSNKTNGSLQQTAGRRPVAGFKNVEEEPEQTVGDPAKLRREATNLRIKQQEEADQALKKMMLESAKLEEEIKRQQEELEMGQVRQARSRAARARASSRGNLLSRPSSQMAPSGLTATLGTGTGLA